MSGTENTSSSKRKDKTILPRYRLYSESHVVLGPGRAELLEHIAETGSISEAARRMYMSYNRAWLHVKSMNEGFREPLVIRSHGEVRCHSLGGSPARLRPLLPR